MKKFKISALIVACLMIISLGVFSLNRLHNEEDSNLDNFYKFEQQVAQACALDEYSEVVLQKEDASMSKLSQSLNLTQTTTASTRSFENEQIDEVYETSKLVSLSANLEFDGLSEICSKLGFVVYEEGNEYKIYSKFVLKRLIVIGNLEGSTYGAINVISGYKDYNILCYETEFLTKQAYERFIDDGKEVYVDGIVSLEEATEESSFNSWGATAMSVDEYLDYLSFNGTDEEVVVAVIDTGLNTSHEMFENRILTDENTDYVGYTYYTTTYTYSGYEFEDDRGHGTHVSGIICDLTPENVKILPIKVFNSSGKGTSTIIISALERIYEVYANDYNVVCANMSLGSGYYQSGYISYTDIIQKLKTEKNVVSVVAAGNESGSTSSYLPASCENAFVVSALKTSGESYAFDSSYSNFGTHVDVSAPGTSIDSAYISSSNSASSNAYKTLSGTSMAAPHVSAVVALLCSDDAYYTTGLATYTASEIETIMIENTIDFGDVGYDIYYGYGMINLSYFSVSRVESKINFYDNGEMIDTSLGYYSFDTSMTLSIECEDETLQIYYTDNGELPTPSNATLYTSPIEISSTCLIGAVAYEIENDEILSATNLFEVKLFSANDDPESYFEIDSEGRITAYSGHFQNLVIPETIDDITVLSIAPSVFKGTELVSVEIPETCTVICGYAFQDCANLEYVSAPGVEKLYIAVFKNCPKIEYVSSTELEDGQKGVYLPRLKESIGYAFANNEGLKSVYLDGLTTISEALFYCCENLETCEIPNVTTIADATFYGCKALTNFTIGKNVVSVGEFAFYESGITNLLVHSENKYLYSDGRALYDINSLVYYFSTNGSAYSICDSVVIGGKTRTITNIDDCSMMYTNFSELTIPETITYIGGNCLYNGSIGTLIYKAKSATYDGYIVAYEDSTGVALPFGYTFIQNLVIDEVVESVPMRVFQGAYVNNLRINSNETSFASNSLYFYGLENIYFEFDSPLNYAYMYYFYNYSAALYFDPNIFTKYEFSDFTIDGYELCGVVGEFGLYSVYDLTGYKMIDFESYSVVTLYDGLEHNVAVFVDDAVESYTITYGFTAGDYTFTSVEGDDLFTNVITGLPVYFKISADGYLDAYGSASLTIKNSLEGGTALTITLQNQFGVYGEDVVVDSSLYYSDLNVDISDIVLKLSTNAEKNNPAGEYEISAEIISSGGYDITIVNSKYIIKSREINIQIGSTSFVYGNNIVLPNNLYEVVSGEVINNDILEIELTTDADNKSDVDTYAIRMKSSSNPNYEVYAQNGTLTILRREISFKIGNKECVYGNIDISDAEVSLASGSIVNNDDIGISLYTAASNSTKVGEYYIDLTYSNNNYSVEYDAGILTVLPRSLVVKIYNQTIDYGSSLNKSSDYYTVTEGEVINGDDLGVDLYSEGSSVGEYDILATNSNENYNISFEYGVLTIIPLSVTIQIGDSSSVYGEEIILDSSNYTLSLGNILSGDEIDLTLSTTATRNSVVGTYVITAVSNSKNYNCTILEGVYKITKRRIVVNLKNQTVDYSENIKIDQTAYEIVSGTIVGTDDLKLSITTGSEVYEMLAGNSYRLVGECGNSNYDVYFYDARITINEKEEKISNTTIIYIVSAIVGLAALGFASLVGRKKKSERPN